MATVSAVISEVRAFQENAHSIVWGPLTTTNDVGSAVEMPGSYIRSIQFEGTFGAGGTIVLQGSNEATPTNWQTLSDVQGNDISKTSADLEQCQDVSRWVRPKVTAGDGTTSLTATMILVRRGR